MTDARNLRGIINEIVTSAPFCQQLQNSLQSALQNVTPLTPRAQLNVQPQVSSSAIDEVRRLFPSVHRTPYTNLQTPEGRRKSKSRKSDSGVAFKKEVILLDNPMAKATLTGLCKSQAYEKGFGFSAVNFKKNWTEEVKFEVLIPMSRCLVKPNLATDCSLDGTAVCEMFKQKAIYLRPLSMLEGAEVEQDNDGVGDELFEFRDCPEVEIIEDANKDNSVEFLSLDTSDIFSDQFEEDTIKAINISKCESLKDILTEFKNNIDSEHLLTFNIYREEILDCCLRVVRRKSFSPLHRISVIFTDIADCSEGAVDQGGPSREMFRLLLNEIKNCKMFEGYENSKNLRLCNECLKTRDYFDIGRLIVLSLIHGGPGPQFFSKTLFSMLTQGIDATEPTLDDINDRGIKTEIEHIQNTNNLEELRQGVLNSSFLHLAGIFHVKSFEEKNSIIKDAVKFYVIHRVRAAYDQLKDGLNILNFLNRGKEMPSDLKKLFCFEEVPLTAEFLKTFFVPVLNEVGSNKRAIENRLLAFWRDYLIDCEDNETTVCLKQILAFVTGADAVPPLGFECTPTLEFLHDDRSRYPKANTCALILSLPVIHTVYEQFKIHMDYGIGNGMVFAFA
ncbi:G2/M phase-specific E3 ubiquitin-protein ligase-like isoform X2 [Photinus pyralis]|uniref:G2/M phase-specific E3 ubiquitin-protein ligase-like isoform X2 n=1 Tax=Photinus pyralis TaxID=7054 RepID=UPI0012672405|nr:G2/M phase-specific E3 ubiquitin-protein ligase-like isoform X2 [Photinus pyralis]XP_031359302.1 G2/M phase-specific E3 ubiquitin-protein ligase-like isoform X2 [Photinus pyralis]